MCMFSVLIHDLFIIPRLIDSINDNLLYHRKNNSEVFFFFFFLQIINLKEIITQRVVSQLD